MEHTKSMAVYVHVKEQCLCIPYWNSMQIGMQIVTENSTVKKWNQNMTINIIGEFQRPVYLA